jgi:RNA-directed DNA polymerase
METILGRENMMAAYRRVVANKGAPGIDAMTVDQLKAYLTVHWPHIREDLLADRYRPAPVRGEKSPSPAAKGCGNWASRPYWTGSSSRRCIRC